MAKKPKKVKLSSIRDLDGADKALLRIGKAQAQRKKLEASNQLKIVRLKEELDAALAPLNEEIAQQDEVLMEFIESHRAELFSDDRKSKELVFGKLASRQATKIEIKSVEKTLNALRSNDWKECIKTTETIIKKELEKFSDDDLKIVGAKRVTDDILSYTVDEERAVKEPG